MYPIIGTYVLQFLLRKAPALLAQIPRIAASTFRSQTVATPSSVVAARVWPSGLKASTETGPVVTVSGSPIVVGWSGSVTFHSAMVPTLVWPAAARVLPSGLNAIDQRLPPGMVRGWPLGVR